MVYCKSLSGTEYLPTIYSSTLYMLLPNLVSNSVVFLKSDEKLQSGCFTKDV